jgi:hypothetical protein
MKTPLHFIFFFCLSIISPLFSSAQSTVETTPASDKNYKWGGGTSEYY